MIKLANFSEEDFPQLIEWISSPELCFQWSGLSFTYPLTNEQLAQYIEHANELNAKKFVFKAIDRATEEVVGHISIAIDANDCARIGKVFITPNTRGKGYGKQLMNGILAFIFDELQLHKASLGVFDFNETAYNCYINVGFVHEGMLREGRKLGDQYFNLIEMGILRSEWERKAL